MTPAIDAWLQRWARIGLVEASGRVASGKEAELLFRAGRTARLTRRPGAVGFTSGIGAGEIAGLLTDAGVDYALTGDAGANLYRSSAGEAWPVLYVEDIASAAAAADLTRKEPALSGCESTLIPFDGVRELGRIAIDGTAVAARDQVILDAYGAIGRMAEQADILLGRRVA